MVDFVFIALHVHELQHLCMFTAQDNVYVKFHASNSYSIINDFINTFIPSIVSTLNEELFFKKEKLSQ